MTNSVIRLSTCGSVDDGKSTLIGRLLVESKSVPYDTINAAMKTRRSGSTISAGEIDFSLFTDGLEAEREQGITIDVAYRSMRLLNGKRLIISDAPGHEQYTRNMVVAASRAQIGLVLVDATKGVRTQTLRHLYICNLMRVNRIIVAVNKLDVVGYHKETFDSISTEISKILNRLAFKDAVVIPLSALCGDNVVSRTSSMPWYSGPTLLDAIQEWQIPPTHNTWAIMRAQIILRSNNFRGVAGTVYDGEFKVGDRVTIFPSLKAAEIVNIAVFKKNVDRAGSNEAITLELKPEVDVARGDIISTNAEKLNAANRFAAHLVWLDEEPLIPSRSYMLHSGCSSSPVIVTKIKYRVDVNSGEHLSANTLSTNDIGEIEIATDVNMVLKPYEISREFGNFIIVDRLTQRTVGAGLIRHALHRATNVQHQYYDVNKAKRSAQKNQKGRVVWLTGLSGSGKSTIANALDAALMVNGAHSYVLDGDNLRLGLNMDLGFSPKDRAENVRRVSEVAKLMVDAGLIVITALVSPFEADRNRAKSIFEEGEFLEVYINTPLFICQERDPKGLYKKSKLGGIPNFTGISQDYQVPTSPDLILDGTVNLEDNVAKLIKIII